MGKHRKKRDRLYSKQAIMDKYGLSKGIIDQYFPAPIEKNNPHRRDRPIQLWSESMIRSALKKTPVKRELDKIKKRREKQLKKQEEIRNFLLSYDVERFRETAREMDRRFIIHVGPTNSGKTYDAIQALKNSSCGLYLGPLRLLALEMFDNLNADGCPCNLLTGEEFINVPGADFTASTIELCDYSNHYDVAVIDEAQMVADRNRGDKWLRAIYCVDAAEVHICLAPEAIELICSLLSGFDADYTIVEHKRFTPLFFSGAFRTIKDARKGDALIVFSRKAVLAVAAELEQYGIKTSVIYGALPPASRREEIRKFTSGETEVVVATDAIGMGVSLPIRRIIFCEVTKFDGVHTRMLLPGEIKQISGRAGRYGIYDEGYVLSMLETSVISQGLAADYDPVSVITLPFPEEALDSEYRIDKLLTAWDELPDVPGISRADMADAIELYSYLKPFVKDVDKKQIFKLIICPFDIKDEELVQYWHDCSLAILDDRMLPEPYSGEDTLTECERKYRELDIRHQLLRGIGIEEDRMEEKLALCKKINTFLTENKEDYLRRCRRCGKLLPATYSYGLCEKCYQRQFW